MPQANPCPRDDALQLLALGRIAAAEAEPLERHVADCPRCADALGRLEARDVLVDTLRAPRPPQAAVHGARWQEMILCFKRLRPADATVTLEPPTPPTENPTLRTVAPLSPGDTP